MTVTAVKPSAMDYLDLVGDFCVEVSAAGRVTLANRAAWQGLGYGSPEGLVGHDWFETAVPPELREVVRHVFARLLEDDAAGYETHEHEVRARDGSRHLVSWRNTVVHDHQGVPRGVLSVGRDVTETRAVAHQLSFAEQQLQAYMFALDQSAIVAITDPKGKITFVNDRFCELSKYTREELIGRDHRIVNSGYHPREYVAELWRTIKAGRVWKGDLRNRAKDGSIYWVATTIVPFLGPDQKPYQYVSIRFEITQRKLAESALEHTIRDLAIASERERQRAEALAEARDRLEEANRRIRDEHQKLLQAEKLSSIGLLAAGVAHEINNPLAGVMNCLKALENGRVPDASRDEYFRTAREGLERIRETVRGLLDYAGRRPPTRQMQDVAEVVAACQRLIEPTLRKKSIQIEPDVALGQVGVSVDRTQIMQALINIMLNAAQAAPDGSTVTVSVTRAPGRVGIAVRDQGPGMTEEVIKNACDPFFTTKPEGEGTGLGLAVTQSIAHAHGGDLTFDSAPGEGTTVTFWVASDPDEESHARDPARR
jgi:PAS domain S-box-containing protein